MAAAAAASSALREDVRKRRNARAIVESLRVLSAFERHAGLVDPLVDALAHFKSNKSDGEENKLLRAAYEYLYGVLGARALTERQACSIALQLARGDTHDASAPARRACAFQLWAWVLGAGFAGDMLHDLARRLDTELGAAVRAGAHRVSSTGTRGTVLSLFSGQSAAQRSAAEQAYCLPPLLSAVACVLPIVFAGVHAQPAPEAVRAQPNADTLADAGSMLEVGRFTSSYARVCVRTPLARARRGDCSLASCRFWLTLL